MSIRIDVFGPNQYYPQKDMTAPSNSLEQYVAAAEISLDTELLNQLQLESDLFTQEIHKCERSMDSSDCIEYFICSTKFISQWQQLVDRALQGGPVDGTLKLKLPEEMNVNLIQKYLSDFDEHELKRQIQEGVDYKFVNKQVMQIFEMYRGPRIPRRAYYSGVSKLIEVYPIKFEMIYLSEAVLKAVRNQDQQHHEQTLKVRTSLAYKNETVRDLADRMIAYRMRFESEEKQYEQARVYSINKYHFTADSLAKELRSIDDPEKQYMKMPGDELRQDMMIGDINIPEDYQPLLIFQLKSQSWIYTLPQHIKDQKYQRCQFCRRQTLLKFACRCQQVEYCCQICQENDYKYHIRSCAKVLEEDNEDPTFERTQKSKYGLVGLRNLGNTCYMNSALQCLQHTRDLSGYFASKNYLKEINIDNPIGSKGKLVRSYAKFIHEILTTPEDVVSPNKLKYVVGRVKEMFMGYEQHDGGEFLLFLLDTLHEDLNRVLKKAYAPGVEDNGQPEEELARLSWFSYLKRNQSYINDLMGGQYRSQVKCPDCQQISKTFDPFLIFSVPIPSNDARTTNIYFFYPNYQKPTLKMTIISKNNTVRELREDAASKANVQIENTRFFILGFNGPVREVSDTETVDRIINEKQFDECGQQRQLFGLEFFPQEIQDIDQKRFLIFKFLSEAEKHKTETFKRPFPFSCQNLQGSQLYDRICQFLLRLCEKIPPDADKHTLQDKYMAFRQKATEQETFKLHMAFGKPQQTMNSIEYENRVEILEDTNVSELLENNNYQCEFEIVLKPRLYLSFNNFCHYNKEDAFDSYSHKLGSEEKYTLEECLLEMKKPEQLLEGNEVFCSKCKDFKLAEKTMEMYKASKYLILQLKRFKQVGYEKSKNHARIEFPFELDLENHLINPSMPEAYFVDCTDKQNQQIMLKPHYWKGFSQSKTTKYRLYAVSNHYGTLGSGHYTAYAEHRGKWYEFDDSRVSEIEESSVVSSASYILFYERIDAGEAWPPLQVISQEEQMQDDPHPPPESAQIISQGEQLQNNPQPPPESAQVISQGEQLQNNPQPPPESAQVISQGEQLQNNPQSPPESAQVISQGEQLQNSPQPPPESAQVISQGEQLQNNPQPPPESAQVISQGEQLQNSPQPPPESAQVISQGEQLQNNPQPPPESAQVISQGEQLQNNPQPPPESAQVISQGEQLQNNPQPPPESAQVISQGEQLQNNPQPPPESAQVISQGEQLQNNPQPPPESAQVISQGEQLQNSPQPPPESAQVISQGEQLQNNPQPPPESAQVISQGEQLQNNPQPPPESAQVISQGEQLQNNPQPPPESAQVISQGEQLQNNPQPPPESAQVISQGEQLQNNPQPPPESAQVISQGEQLQNNPQPPPESAQVISQGEQLQNNPQPPPESAQVISQGEQLQNNPQPPPESAQVISQGEQLQNNPQPPPESAQVISQGEQLQNNPQPPPESAQVISQGEQLQNNPQPPPESAQVISQGEQLQNNPQPPPESAQVISQGEQLQNNPQPPPESAQVISQGEQLQNNPQPPVMAGNEQTEPN